MNPVINRFSLVTITAAIPLTVAAPLARAEDAERITAIEQQINALRRELEQMKQNLARRDADLQQARREAVAARLQAGQAAQPPLATALPSGAAVQAATPQTTPPREKGEFQLGGVTIRLVPLHSDYDSLAVSG